MFLCESQNIGVYISLMKKKICTHDGRFHCDEVLACTLLRKFTEHFRDAEVVRSRDPSVWAGADIVVDVGGKYQPPKCLDHHQIEFQSCYPNNNVRMSSAGLVYLHYPEIIPNVIADIIAREQLPFAPAKSQQVIEQVRQKIYKNLIIYVDANDNGVDKVNDKDVSSVPTTLWARVAKANPMWWDENADELALFYKAMDMVEEEFYSEVRQVFLGSLQTKQIVKEAFLQRKEVHASGRIVKLEKYVPWQKPVVQIEEEAKCEGEVLFVVFPQKSGKKWRIQGVAKKEGSFELRLPLRGAWRGIKDEQKLKELSGLQDIDFVHASGFIGGAVSMESAVAMGVMSMELN